MGRFKDFKSFKFPWNATYLEWIEPETEESLSEYADRLLGAYPSKKMIDFWI